jgi:hypothetical protein
MLIALNVSLRSELPEALRAQLSTAADRSYSVPRGIALKIDINGRGSYAGGSTEDIFHPAADVHCLKNSALCLAFGSRSSLPVLTS